MENQPFQQKPISARASGQQRLPQRPTPPRMPQRQPIQTQRVSAIADGEMHC